MSNGYAQEALDEILESMESDEAAGLDEAAAPRRFRPPNLAAGTGLFQPRGNQTTYVTQVQLQAALARVGNQIKVNSEAIKAINGRINTVSAEQSKQVAALKKLTEERKKESAEIKKDVGSLKSNVMLAGLLPLLSRPPEVTLTSDAGGIPAGTKVLVDQPNSMSTLLPILLLGGMDSSSSGGLLGGGSDSNATMLLLLLALGGNR